MGPVAQVLAMDRTTLTAALKPLERRGLVEQSADPLDKRSRRLHLTEAGHTLLSAALPVWERCHSDLEAAEPAIDTDTLRASLRALS